MTDQILFLVSYPCPGCGTDLETGPRAVETWLRCPRCDRASLPPTYQQTLPQEIPVPVEAQVDPEIFYIGPFLKEPTMGEKPLEPTTAPPIVSGLSGQRVALMVVLMMGMGAVADGVISRNLGSGFVGFLMVGSSLIWMVARGVRL